MLTYAEILGSSFSQSQRMQIYTYAASYATDADVFRQFVLLRMLPADATYAYIYLAEIDVRMPGGPKQRRRLWGEALLRSSAVTVCMCIRSV
jgi:hypothetical protein